MKLIINKYATLTALVIMCIFSSCNDADYSILKSRAFFDEAQGALGGKIIVNADEPTEAKVHVKLSHQASEECVYRILIDTIALEKYNKFNGTGYITLPDESYHLPEEIVVKSGDFQAEETIIIINPFTEEMISSGESFALPIKLDLIKGNIEPMAQSASFVITTESIFRFSAPILNGRTKVNVDMKPGEITLDQFTVEFRFQIKQFYENQAFFDGGGSGNDQVYIRLEDPIGTYNLIQIVGKGTYLNAKTPFEKNKWQHLAIAFDGSKYLIYVNGKLDAQKEVAPGPVTFSKIQFISSGNYFPSDCLLSEMRLWGKSLSQNQIQNNMTVTSPKSDGLRAYWKMNEGKGNIFEDITGNGYTATAEGNVRWIHGILSTDDTTEWN